MKIDVVMPWVDGADPCWLEEKSKYMPKTGEDGSPNRYRDWELLRYWFRGIEKYMPWVNAIHFITWGHLPQWLNKDSEKLRIVRHEDYIPQKYLPVFSSHPIELNLHRIKDLEEHFIYFNDDTYVINYMKPEDFFLGGLPTDTVTEVPLRFNPGGIDHIIGNDMMVINSNFSKEQVIRGNRKKWFSLHAPKAAVKNLYMKPVKGFSAFDNPHLPMSFLKKTFDEVWEKESKILDDTCTHKFRSNEDVNSWLIRYWQLVTGQFAQTGKNRGKFFSIGRDDREIRSAFEKRSYPLICLSDDNIDVDFEKERAMLTALFESILPDKSGFEL